MHEDELDDLGPPVEELRDLAEPPKPGFLQGVRNRIERRAFAGNMLDLSIPLLGEVFREYLTMIFSIFGSEKNGQTRKDASDE